MTTRAAALLGCALLCASAGLRCSAPPADPGAVAFAYADASGSRLLSLEPQEQEDVSLSWESLDTALCADGRALPIRHLEFQQSGDADTHRQSVDNFTEDEGHLFEIVGEQAAPGDTCLLMSSALLRGFPIVPNDLTRDERAARPHAYRLGDVEADVDALTKATLDRLQVEKGRTPALYWLLHRTGESQVAVVEFEAQGSDLLASLVLVEPQQLSLQDMPANREDGDCWRADDGCVFDPSGMDVVAVLGHPGDRLVFLTWWGPEGQSITLLRADDARLVTVRRAYRYHAPV